MIASIAFCDRAELVEWKVAYINRVNKKTQVINLKFHSSHKLDNMRAHVHTLSLLVYCYFLSFILLNLPLSTCIYFIHIKFL